LWLGIGVAHGAINIYGSHTCPSGQVWDGWECDYPTSEPEGGPVNDDPTGADDTGGYGGGGVYPTSEPESSDPCEDCEASTQACQTNAEKVADTQAGWHKKDALKTCGKKFVSDVRARGGRSIEDLRSGTATLPGFTKEDWEHECGYRSLEFKGAKAYLCDGEYLDSCAKSYERDFPSAEFGGSSTVSMDLSLADIGFGASGTKTVTYSHGGGTGWHTAVAELRAKLYGLCSAAQFDCLSANDCGKETP